MRLGPLLLAGALAVEVYGIGASLLGTRPGRRRWADSGRRAVYVTAALLTLAFASLELAFLRSDLGLRVVAEHSSTTTPAFYRATAAWSAQEGSLLLWAWLLSLWSSLVLVLNRGRMPDITPWAQAVLLGFAAFFCGLLVFAADPFARLVPAAHEGSGLTPLLRHPSMMFHPPILYSGYTLFAIPFAFAVGALATGRLDAEWIGRTRRFSLAAWSFLGLGILLGARWSYAELGWGGYWAWDPVENASLMPWLCATAFLHSIQVQERRGMLKAWNVSLVLASGVLAVLGTFLVRSGILSSIHAFGASTLGVPFVVLIAVLTFGSVALVTARRRELRSEGRLDSLLSREAAFLLNNLVLVGLCVVVLWGTFFPLISEALTGTRSSLGPPWFDRYTVPLALALVGLAALGPVLSWRRTTPRAFARVLAAPLGFTLLVGVAAATWGHGTRHPAALAMFCLAALVIATAARELWVAARARARLVGERTPSALAAVVGRNRRRYGGYTVHVGMAVLFVGVAASSSFGHVVETRLRPGQSARVGAYELRYARPWSELSAERIALGAVLEVSRGGRRVATLTPSRDYYPSLDQGSFGRIGRFFNGEAESQIGLRAGLARDVWTAVQPDLSTVGRQIANANRRFAGANPALEGFVTSLIVRRWAAHATADFRLIVSPLVIWLWIGGVTMVGGALLAAWPLPRTRTARVVAPHLGWGAARRARRTV